MIHQVFPTLIYQASLKPASWSKKKWADFLQDLEKEVYTFAAEDDAGHLWCEKNSYLGYTSYGSLSRLDLISPTFQELERIFRSHISSFSKSLQYSISEDEFSATSLWMNIMPEGCFHTSHIHPLSVISGTFYLNVDDESSSIKFEDPRLTNFMNQPLKKNSSRQTSPYHVEIKPRVGEIVLFESWLRHEVPVQKAKTERVSLSFNYGWSHKERSTHGTHRPVPRSSQNLRKKRSP